MPLTRKLLLKDEYGVARAVLTVTFGEHPALRLPDGVKVVAALTNEKILLCPSGEAPALQKGTTDLSLVAEYAKTTLFATTLTGEAARLAKWRLTERARESTNMQKVPTTPLTEVLSEERIESETSEDETAEDPGTREPVDALFPEAEKQDPVAKARRLIEEGEPFSLFENLMPNSKWAKIQNEECLCLVGIVKEDDRERVLYGIAGTPGFPPDEDKLWTYFPTGDEEGYYLTEYDQVQQAE